MKHSIWQQGKVEHLPTQANYSNWEQSNRVLCEEEDRTAQLPKMVSDSMMRRNLIIAQLESDPWWLLRCTRRIPAWIPACFGTGTANLLFQKLLSKLHIYSKIMGRMRDIISHLQQLSFYICAPTKLMSEKDRCKERSNQYRWKALLKEKDFLNTLRNNSRVEKSTTYMLHILWFSLQLTTYMQNLRCLFQIWIWFSRSHIM